MFTSHTNTQNKWNIHVSISDIYENKIVKNTNYIRPDPAERIYDKLINFTSALQNLHA